jgi:predicted nucleic acid-binding protein
MEIDPSTYPSRAFIRFTAQNQLRANLTGESITVSVQRLGEAGSLQQVTPHHTMEATSDAPEDSLLDEVLFEEIAKTTFSANRYPELYQPCGTQRAAKAIEAQVAAEIVEAYHQIKQRQKCPLVERLNNLL